MKNYLPMLLLVGLFCWFSACQNEAKPSFPVPLETIAGIPVYDFKQLSPLFDLKNDTTYIINFWATWCKPCVEELPAFEKLNAAYKDKAVQVILVSLDFKKQIEKKLVPFLKERNLQSKVVFLDDPKTNTWINKVNPEWSGAIPATVVVNNGEQRFYEQQFTYEELEKLILP